MRIAQNKAADYAGPARSSLRPVLIAVFFLLSWQLAFGSDGRRELQCSENNAKLTQYVSEDQKVHALWGQKYKDDHFFYCGFTEDHKIRLTDLNWFVNNRTLFRQRYISSTTS